MFNGKGDQEVGLEPGNIVIVLDEQEHDKFTRRGNNLHMLMKMNLTEALCGCRKPIKTLDGRIIAFHLLPGLFYCIKRLSNIILHLGEVIKHEDKKVILGEGMPMYRHPDERGDLIIHFNVEFPEKIPQQNLKQLHALLPGKNEAMVPGKTPSAQYELKIVAM